LQSFDKLKTRILSSYLPSRVAEIENDYWPHVVATSPISDNVFEKICRIAGANGLIWMRSVIGSDSFRNLV
jgi:hypothetical protein